MGYRPGRCFVGVWELGSLWILEYPYRECCQLSVEIKQERCMQRKTWWCDTGEMVSVTDAKFMSSEVEE